MSTFTRHGSSVLKTTPFFFFETGISSLALVLCFYKISAPNNITFYLVLAAYVLSSAISGLYNYERNLNYTKQLQLLIVFYVIWVLFYTAGSLIFLSAIEVPFYKTLLFFGFIFVTKTITIMLLFVFRKRSPYFQEKILVYMDDTGKSFIRDVNQLKRTGYKIYEGEKTLFEKEKIRELKEMIQHNKIKSVFIPLQKTIKNSSDHILDLAWGKQLKIKLLADYNSPVIGKKAMFYAITQVFNYNISRLDFIFNLSLIHI